MELYKVNPTGTLFGSSSEHRFNGVIPHWPKTHGCSVNGHVRQVNLKNSRSALVTGGAGYFGFRLSCTLAQTGVSVILVDIHKPRWCLPEGAVFLQLHKEQIESINIGGTRKVIDVCLHRNIPCLIYTSTVNVVFGGQQIHQGDEDTVPYVPLDKHVDHYSKTKAIADQMVLAADGTSLKGGKKFRTCVLRPPGIYGPQEQRHLARVAVNIERRLFSFTFGNPDTKMNWVHVDNLVQAHILAGEALTAAKGHIACPRSRTVSRECLAPVPTGGRSGSRLRPKLGSRTSPSHLPPLTAGWLGLLPHCRGVFGPGSGSRTFHRRSPGAYLRRWNTECGFLVMFSELLHLPNFLMLTSDHCELLVEDFLRSVQPRHL
ncbi:hypothetical protein chiPu_0006503 [Chiloscyllium punctatum]|uniref:3-beta hydroxysteroid dehydrogenase/isomerase domain-containing protein n=1 Tax=Chiloscyllium punctatum TaxID=137246 RepID=A0A401SCD6_CHIPU|nr:hypothetical protein [Chiloscyllium punctatum]